jgi:hypothetical protein
MIRRLGLGGTLWNWKAALLSAVCRAFIFLTANLPAGVAAGWRAFATEFAFRIVASGLLGSLTERCATRNLSPTAIAAAVIGIAAAGHAAEYLVHRVAGTQELRRAVAGSVLFTLATTCFNLYAMHRGVLRSGPGRQSLRDDLRALPQLVVQFLHIPWTSRRCI